MTYWNSGLLVLAVLAATVGSARAEEAPSGSLLGLWLTQDGDAHIRLERCSDGLCGSIVWMKEPLDETGAERRDAENPDPALRDRPVQGLTILRIGDAPDARGVYGEGRIYDPKSGRTYRCTLRHDGEGALKLRGYLGISLLGRTSRWVRLEADPEAFYAAPTPDAR